MKAFQTQLPIFAVMMGLLLAAILVPEWRTGFSIASLVVGGAMQALVLLATCAYPAQVGVLKAGEELQQQLWGESNPVRSIISHYFSGGFGFPYIMGFAILAVVYHPAAAILILLCLAQPAVVVRTYNQYLRQGG